MTSTRTMLCAAALAAPMVLLASPAQATTRPTYRDPQVAWVSDVQVKRDRVSVLAKYRCYGGDEGTHVWVSVKQGGGIDGKTAEELAQLEGTSAIADAWYDTNQTDPSSVYLVCNGRWQVQRYTLGQAKGELERGSAFLQFCLFDSTANQADPAQGFAYAYELVKVKVHHRHGRHR